MGDEADLGTLVRLPLDHPVLAIDEAPSEPLLLGREEGTPVFASDISGWDPATGDLSQLNAFLDPTLQQHPDLPDGTAFAELRRTVTRLSPRDAGLAATAKAIAG